MVRIVRRLAAALILVSTSVRAHDVIDPARLEQLLIEIARTQQARAEALDPEAVYDLGEKVEAVVALLDQDVDAHGPDDLLARLVVGRLRTYGVHVRYGDPARRHAYDLAAFREYLSRAPDGPRAAAAWFRLLARSFHDSVGADPSRLEDADVGAVARAAAEEERFLARYPADVRAKEVRFFLAVDYYRLSRSDRPARRARYVRLGREALELLRARYPGTMEARTAEALLENLAATGKLRAR